jgi:hypothetical protein
MNYVESEGHLLDHWRSLGVLFFVVTIKFLVLDFVFVFFFVVVVAGGGGCILPTLGFM